MDSKQIPLKRSLTLPMLVLYGLGTTIGAGIYALVGELAGIAGYLAPASFLVATIMAALTALSFAELSGRFPHCAGAALYVKEGFSSEHLSLIVGLLVIGAGLTSSAAIIIMAISVFFISLASSRVLPLTHSVNKEELAIADPQP